MIRLKIKRFLWPLPAAAVLISSVFASSASAHGGYYSHKHQSWPSYGGNLEQTNSVSGFSNINPFSVKSRGFRVIWSLKTDPGFNGDNDDDVQPGGPDAGSAKRPAHTPPALYDGKLYFITFGETDIDPGPGVNIKYSGNVNVVNANTGEFLPGFPIDITSYTSKAREFLGRDDVNIRGARNTPIVVNDKIIFGTRINAPTREEYNAGEVGGVVLSVSANDGSLDETGATEGEWASLIDEHPSTRISVSPTYYDGLIYTGSSIPDYSLPGNFYPDYDCCTGRGAVVALDPKDGSIVWKTYMVPPGPKDNEENFDGKIGSANGIDLRSANSFLTVEDEGWYSGGSIWSGAPTIDKKRGLLIVGTGNNGAAPREARLCEIQRRYEQDQLRADPVGFRPLTFEEIDELETRLAQISEDIGAHEVVCDAPHVVLDGPYSAAGKTVALNDAFLPSVNTKGHRSYGNYASSVVALDLKTGAVRWAYRPVEYDAYTTQCDFWFAPISGDVCPEPYGYDADVAHAPKLVNLKRYKGEKNKGVLLGATKQGKVFALNVDDGTPFEGWSGQKDLAQLSIVGGFQFSSSTDGKRYYVNANHSGNSDFFGLVLNDFPGGDLSVHEVCHETLLDDRRATLGGPRFEESAANAIPGCKIPKNRDGSPGLRSTVADYVTAINVKTGKVLWQYADPTGDPALPNDTFRSFKQGGTSVANRVLFSGSRTGIMRMHHARTGKILREINLNEVLGGELAQMIDAPPTIVGNRVYWGTGVSGGFFLESTNPFRGSDNARIVALELCPFGTKVDPDDITKCKKKFWWWW